jgi:hypothetical protein
VSPFLALLNQHGQLHVAEEVALVAAVTLAVAAVSAASLVEALARRQHFTVAAFEQHPLSVVTVHILPAEVSAGQVPHRDSIMVVIA